jgi:hypothetical protein
MGDYCRPFFVNPLDFQSFSNLEQGERKAIFIICFLLASLAKKGGMYFSFRAKPEN